MLKVAKAYAKHEQQLFTDLVALRQGATIQESNQVITNQNDVLDVYKRQVDSSIL